MHRIAFLFVLAGGPTVAADWPQWRGIHRDGKSAETGLLRQWPAGGPKLLWKAQGLGSGYSSFSVSQDMLFTQGQRGGTQYVMAFDVVSGKKLWETANGRAFEESRGNGPRSVPTVEGDRLWAYSADGTLACLEIKTGKRIWQYNAVEKFGGEVPRWGISESPLVDGDRLIVSTGGRGAAIAALNKNTGEPVWRSLSDPAAYSSPILAQAGGVRLVLAFTENAAVGVRSDNGEPLWRYPRVANRTANIATPVFHNGFAFYSSDYGTGAVLLQLQPDGGAVKASEVYFTRDMRNHYSSSVLVGEHLYGYSSSILTAMRLMTGEVAWQARGVGKGSVVYADGHLYCLGEEGSLALVEATPSAYREKSRLRLAKGNWPLWSLPVIANGKLYVRDQDTLYSFDIQAPQMR